MKVKNLALIAVVVTLLFASQAFFNMDTRQAYPADVTAYWLGLAENAWSYFQPGKGVDATTGLHRASLDWPYFTDWDLGLYIQTIIDAEKVGVLSPDGAWGANARLEKILAFLETRELTADGLPFWWYESRTGHRSGEGSPDVTDTGKLLVALQNLKLCRPDLEARVNHVVYERVNYTSMWNVIINEMPSSASIYAYYITSGFAGFWPDRFSSVADEILNNIVSAPKVETYGVTLPKTDVLCEPLLYSFFELKPDVRVLDLTQQVYLAHEARYNATGKYTAFSEGNTALNDSPFAYEWVVLSDGRTWVVKDQKRSDAYITPIIYYKVAISFLAIYDTEFSRDMIGYLDSHIPHSTNGHAEGIDEDGRLVSVFIDKTNGMIISAARYAIEHGNPEIAS